MGKFTFTETEIPGVVVIEPQVFGDDRGYFMETYQKDQFAAAGATLCVMRVMRLRKTKNRAKAAKSFSIYNKITKNDKTKQRGK